MRVRPQAWRLVRVLGRFVLHSSLAARVHCSQGRQPSPGTKVGRVPPPLQKWPQMLRVPRPPVQRREAEVGE